MINEYLCKRCSIVGVNDNEGPPVPIPNTVVKLIRAEDTWREAARKNRSMPTQKRQSFSDCLFYFPAKGIHFDWCRILQEFIMNGRSLNLKGKYCMF